MASLNLRSGFWIATGIFVFFIALGWFFPQAAKPLLQPGWESLAGTIEQTEQLDVQFQSIGLAVFIFLKNLSVAAIIVLIGHFLLATPTVFILAVNGGLVGLLARIFIESGLAPIAFLAGVAPHGIIELPTIWLAAGLALSAAHRRLQGKSIPGFIERAQFLILIIAPLLLVAAFIEVFITPLILTPFL